ncbi:hypothetical protein ABBQ38_000161 [Trebouxia sp. C0009 RCD-2024]
MWQTMKNLAPGSKQSSKHSAASVTSSGNSKESARDKASSLSSSQDSIPAAKAKTPIAVRFADDWATSPSNLSSPAASFFDGPAANQPKSSGAGYNHPNYDTLQLLGEGTFGAVHLGRDRRTSEPVAIKYVARGAGISKSVLREILNQRLCGVHPSIIQFKEVFLTPKSLAIVMEYAPGGDLFEYVLKHKASVACQGLPEDTARWFFQQMMVALDFCHELGIANRDIKLENILLNDALPLPHLKICDFGYSKNEYIDSRPKTVSGTPDYIAPEVLLDDQYDGKKADIWSCGVMLYVMLTGVLPFARKGDAQSNDLLRLQQMFPRIVAANFTQPPHVSPECQQLLSKLLKADPETRITVSDVLQDPWFLFNLPPGTEALNQALLQSPISSGFQTVEDLEHIVNEARENSGF